MKRTASVKAVLLGAVALVALWGAYDAAPAASEEVGPEQIGLVEEMAGAIAQDGQVRQRGPTPTPTPTAMLVVPSNVKPNVKQSSGILISPVGDIVQTDPPPRESDTKIDTELVLVPEHLRPGKHTLTLGVRQSTWRGGVTVFQGFFGACIWAGFHDADDEVGWGNSERSNGDPCTAFVMQMAVDFDGGLLDQVSDKTIDRAVLTYEEAQGDACEIGGVGVIPCWSDGEGNQEHKPDGCVVVRVPTVDWRANPPSGLIPYDPTGRPAVRWLGPREWDVTEPYRWQNVSGGAPLGANPVYGYLLSGWSTLDQLEGQDNTHCISKISNVRLLVSYEVPKDSPPPSMPR
jgi:hypothetical protein